MRKPIAASLKADDETIACAEPACGATLGTRLPRRMWKDLTTGVRYREPTMSVTLRLGYRRDDHGMYSMPRHARDRLKVGRTTLHRRPVSVSGARDVRRSPEIAALDPVAEPRAFIECFRCGALNYASTATLRLIDERPDKWADEIKTT
jgi:hypothetical protein